MDKHTPDLRMDAYYYGFGSTGVYAVDLVLSAVACAGKAYHHTDCWFDESTPYDGHTGSTPVEWIQNAGNAAAEEFAKINAINAELLEALSDIEEIATSLEATVGQLHAKDEFEDDIHIHEKWAMDELMAKVAVARAALAKARGEKV